MRSNIKKYELNSVIEKSSGKWSLTPKNIANIKQNWEKWSLKWDAKNIEKTAGLNIRIYEEYIKWFEKTLRKNGGEE